MSSDNLRANVTGVVDKDDSKRDVFLKLDALRNEVKKINVNLHKLFSIIAELREEISVIREERDEEKEKYQNLLSEMSTFRIGSQIDPNPFITSTPARREQVISRNTLAQSSQSIPVVTHSSTLNSSDIEKLSIKDLIGIVSLSTIKLFTRTLKLLGGEDDALCKILALNKMERDLRIFVYGELEILPEGGKFGDRKHFN